MSLIKQKTIMLNLYLGILLNQKRTLLLGTFIQVMGLKKSIIQHKAVLGGLTQKMTINAQVI